MRMKMKKMTWANTTEGAVGGKTRSDILLQKKYKTGRSRRKLAQCFGALLLLSTYTQYVDGHICIYIYMNIYLKVANNHDHFFPYYSMEGARNEIYFSVLITNFVYINTSKSGQQPRRFFCITRMYILYFFSFKGLRKEICHSITQNLTLYIYICVYLKLANNHDFFSLPKRELFSL